MNSDPRVGSDKTKRRSRTRAPQQTPPAEDELETGEPIPGEGDPMPAAKKIPALRGNFDAKPSDQTETSKPSDGEMVLSTAKYLNTHAGRPDGRTGQKHDCNPEETGQSFEGRALNGGVWGGLLAMVVAVVWFMAGMMNGVFFFYPPILFILGLVSFCKAPSREG